MSSALAVEGLSRAFIQGDRTIQVLRGVDLAVAQGEIVALLGPSGSGKSTLLQAVGLLEGGFQGTIRIAGEEASQLDDDGRTRLRRDAIGFVYQFHHLLPDFTAEENVVLPQLIRGTDPQPALERARALLEALALGERRDHRPSQLSGGEQQRVALARAFVHGPELLFADEPTGNLDQRTGSAVSDLLFALNREHGTTLVLVTHDISLASRCERNLRLADGRIDTSATEGRGLSPLAREAGEGRPLAQRAVGEGKP